MWSSFDGRKRGKGVVMTTGDSGRKARHGKPGAHTLTRYLPLATTFVGVTLVVTSVALFYVESDVRGLVSVTIGLPILISSVWFAANPIRRYTRLYRYFRREISHFLSLAQLLNKQVVAEAGPEFVARTTAKMHGTVDRMVAEADKTS